MKVDRAFLESKGAIMKCQKYQNSFNFSSSLCFVYDLLDSFVNMFFDKPITTTTATFHNFESRCPVIQAFGTFHFMLPPTPIMPITTTIVKLKYGLKLLQEGKA